MRKVLTEVRDVGSQERVPLLPRCAECGSDPAALTTAFVSIGPVRAIVFLCAIPECRAIHGTHFLEMARPEPGKIVVPQ